MLLDAKNVYIRLLGNKKVTPVNVSLARRINIKFNSTIFLFAGEIMKGEYLSMLFISCTIKICHGKTVLREISDSNITVPR